MSGASERIHDANLLWTQGRREGGLLACVAVAARAREIYPGVKDNEAFPRMIREALSIQWSIEFRGEQRPVEWLLYKWVRCELVHNASFPLDIETDGELGEGLAVRAGGAPDYVVKHSPTWFDFLISVALRHD
ncbi:MAG: hypothetical protein J0H98_00680 [Solirubrobacterales bacterium]|nr:hypothetical protein [Solirubrobacterales bacterium]